MQVLIRSVLISFCFLLCGNNLFSQAGDKQGTLSFFVRDAVNYYGTKASILIKNAAGKTEAVVTDNGGHATYKTAPGKYNLAINAEGHKELKTYFAVEQGKEIKAELILDRVNYTPPPIESLTYAIVEGFVIDGATGLPLKNAEILLAGENKKTQTDETGYFKIESAHFSAMQESTDKAVRDVIVVEKPGFGTYEEKNIPLLPQKLTMRITLYPGDKKITSTYTHGVLDAATKKKESLNEESDPEKYLNGGNPPSPQGCIPVPSSIRVGTSCSCTSCSVVNVMSLEAYVGSGLDDEWIASWQANSLNAGAVAYRTYGAWYCLNPVNANYDIASTTCNQAWGSAVYTSVQNAASATASVIIEYNNAIARAEYSAENNNKGCGDGWSGTSTSWPCISDNVCVGQPSNGHGRGMCQWGSQRWANNQGQVWTWILDHYYNPGNYFTSYPSGCSPANLSTAAGTCPVIGVTLSWTNSGNGWYMDVSDDPNFTTFYNKDVSTLTSVTCPGGFCDYPGCTSYLQFKPNTTYYWRIWDGSSHTYGSSFTTPVCATTDNNCTGNFYDSGGPSASYNGNEDYLYTIAPAGATAVIINFNSMDLELNSDSLYVYDGSTTADPLLGAYTGTNNPGSLTANSGAMTFHFVSDPFINNNGWDAAWTCTLGSTKVDQLTNVNNLSVYPNPFNENISVGYSLNGNSQVKISLVDVIGREIILLSENEQAAGAHKLSLETKSLMLTKGVYFLKLESNFKTSVVKLVKN